VAGKNNGLRGLQSLSTSLLEVSISEVSNQQGAVKPFDKDGCPATTGGPSVTKFYAVVKYIIHNSGNEFSPSPAYKGEASCHKPAIFNFLNLEGLIPSVKLSRHATCVVDDELAGEDACASSISNNMTIRSGKSYGSTKTVSVKFTIADSDFATLNNADATTKLDLKLSVNSLISPGVSHEVSVLKGSELGSVDWFNPTVFPAPVILYSVFTQSQSPTSSPTASYVVINNILRTDGNLMIINLAEVQLFNNNVQIPRESLQFTLSSTYNEDTRASMCNDGNLNTLCHSGTSNPSLTIVSAAAFDRVVVYNWNQFPHRIQGSTITATVDGQSQATIFPSAASVYTFLLSSSGLQLYVPPI
jgi:hypothetical protein